MSEPGRLYLVRHGRPVVEPGVPSHRWQLDPAFVADVVALRSDLPSDAHWFSSPEPKARLTACLVTEGPIRLVPDLREQERRADWVADFDRVVRSAFANPQAPAHPGWEPLARTRRRVVSAVRGILEHAPEGDVVLVGHGTAWAVLHATLLGVEADLAWWSGLAMPDVRVLRRQSPGSPGPDDMLDA
ncbi:MAG TPA: histidine phosphatase family protein [Nocardioides sp.]|uniref:histidine phosphatase family protein n=1 Tax=Nocardioides sp. TaxID=35761 RepID=UPI002E3576BD|nr:histidine phosphatase family protein [Nocardioides sp.]HEX3931015.1 histidine phosphatase family protein [Nocardioides sp.]